MSALKIFTPRIFNINCVLEKQLHTSSVCCTKAWRKVKKLPWNKTERGPLTDLPDYSFLDGRPTPIGGHQMRRLMKQREYAKQIVSLTGEVDFAVQRHLDMQAQNKAIRDRILANRLREKGHKMFKPEAST